MKILFFWKLLRIATVCKIIEKFSTTNLKTDEAFLNNDLSRFFVRSFFSSIYWALIIEMLQLFESSKRRLSLMSKNGEQKSYIKFLVVIVKWRL